MIKTLWIEEEASSILSDTKTYMLNNNYYLDIVIDASEAEDKLSCNRYDLIILDIQILAGWGEKWIDLHFANEKLLGLALFEDVISQRKELQERTIIFTNEYWIDIEPKLKKYGFPRSRFLQKINATEQHQLHDFITLQGFGK